MSAFALRKRLLASQEDSTSSSETSPGPAIRGESPKKAVSKPKRARKNGPEIAANIGLQQPQQPLQSISQAPIVSSPQLDIDGTNTPPLEIAPVVLQAQSPAVIFSTYVPTKANYRRGKDGTAVLTLCQSERLVILGNYGICVKSGNITINGTSLGPRPDIVWVDAPQCYALPVIRTIDDAVVKLYPHVANKDLRKLSLVSPLFRGLWLDDEGSTFKIIRTSLDGPKRTMLQDLVSPPEWNREIARLSKAANSGPITVMVTGPKSSGKSTFGKMMANRLLSESASSGSGGWRPSGLAVLDLDPGQPEYGVPGQISLVQILEPVLGPSFTRPVPLQNIRTIRAHSLASITPAADPELYLEAAIDLFTHYRNALGSSSLVINTPGWIQGTGLDLLVSLISELRLTEVVYMSQAGPFDTVEGLQSACKHSIFTTLPSQTASLASRSAAQLRSMQLMTYFHVEAPEADYDSSKKLVKVKPESRPPYTWIITPLTHVPPWEVSYSHDPAAGEMGLAGILCYDYQAPLSLLADAINGNILSVVEVEDARAFRDILSETQSSRINDVGGKNDGMDVDAPNDCDNLHEQRTSLQDFIRSLAVPAPDTSLPYLDTKGTTLDPQYSRSIGLALVRGIDRENQVLQLLTPTTRAEIDRVFAAGHQIVLVSGKFDTPSWAYTEDFYYNQATTNASSGGGNKMRGGMESRRSYGEIYDDDEDDDEEEREDGEGYIAFDDLESRQSAMTTGVTATNTPWIEELRGSQKRGIGSKVWRVRRDLGRSGNTGD